MRVCCAAGDNGPYTEPPQDVLATEPEDIGQNIVFSTNPSQEEGQPPTTCYDKDPALPGDPEAIAPPPDQVPVTDSWEQVEETPERHGVRTRGRNPELSQSSFAVTGDVYQVENHTPDAAAQAAEVSAGSAEATPSPRVQQTDLSPSSPQSPLTAEQSGDESPNPEAATHLPDVGSGAASGPSGTSPSGNPGAC